MWRRREAGGIRERESARLGRTDDVVDRRGVHSEQWHDCRRRARRGRGERRRANGDVRIVGGGGGGGGGGSRGHPLLMLLLLLSGLEAS